MDKKSWLDNLHYNHDKQQGNLELAYAFLDKEGNPKFSKWKKYLDVQSDDKFFTKANNRTILPNEIILDIENPEQFSEVFEKVKRDFQFYSAYKTGSRGMHINLWFNESLDPKEKLFIIKKYGTDEQKASVRCMIALENCPHWKTGKPKILIEENKGINYFERIAAVAEEIEPEIFFSKKTFVPKLLGDFILENTNSKLSKETISRFIIMRMDITKKTELL